MGFTKKDIERARRELWLKEAKRQIGPHIKSLDDVEIVKQAPKKYASLGQQLHKKAKRFGSGGY